MHVVNCIIYVLLYYLCAGLCMVVSKGMWQFSISNSRLRQDRHFSVNKHCRAHPCKTTSEVGLELFSLLEFGFPRAHHLQSTI